MLQATVTLLGATVAAHGCADRPSVVADGAEELPRGEQRAVDDVNEKTYGTPTGGLAASIWVPSREVSMGTPVLVRYAVKNVGAEAATVWHSGFWPNHRIEVTRDDGNPVPKTELGQRRDEAFSPDGQRSKSSPKTLAPGAVDSAWEPVDLTAHYQLTEAGVYRVQFRYEDSQSGLGGPLLSNVLKFSLVPG